MEKAEKFLFGSSNTPGDGLECFCGHCTHRKHGTVGVRSLSIGAFLFDLDDSQPLLDLDNSRQGAFFKNASFQSNAL